MGPDAARHRDRLDREIFPGDDVEWGDRHVGEVVTYDRLGLQVKVTMTTARTYEIGSVVPLDPRSVEVLQSSIFGASRTAS